MGKTGRNAVAARLPALREAWGLDFVVVNGENATGGMGLSAEHAKGILAAGADVVTLGDHAFDQKDMMQFAETDRSLACLVPMIRAGSVEQLYEATRGWGLIDHNLVAADTAGHIGHLVRAIVENPMLNGEVVRLDGAIRMAPR